LFIYFGPQVADKLVIDPNPSTRISLDDHIFNRNIQAKNARLVENIFFVNLNRDNHNSASIFGILVDNKERLTGC
jgi:hypothetical protein